MMGWDSWGWGWPMMVFGMVFMILFWGAIIWLIIWAIRKFSHSGGSGSNSLYRSPLDIAKERYARGEITKDQFDQLKKDL